jgi:hypothetical protein
MERPKGLEKTYSDILEEYNDKIFIYSLLCIQTNKYYNILKYSFQIPLILTSTILSILNSNIKNEESSMKIINTVFNIITALILSINNIFRFESKANNFRNNYNKFQKLSHFIEKKILDKNEINIDLINNIISEYTNIIENIEDEIPIHICNRINLIYNTYKTLPVIITSNNKIIKQSVNNILPNIYNENNTQIDYKKKNEKDFKKYIENIEKEYYSQNSEKNIIVNNGVE